MIVVYWLLALPTAALATMVIALTLSGRKLGHATPDWLSLVAASAVLALVFWGHALARKRGRPLLGVLVTVASWVLFAACMVIHALMTQTIWN